MEVNNGSEEAMCTWKRGKQLGKGGFASVFLATPNPSSSLNNFPPNCTRFAVKSVDVDDSSGLDSLQTEAEILAQLQPSSFVIRYYGTDITIETTNKRREYFNLLLEYASMGSLQDRISTKGLPQPEVRYITRQLLMGIRYIHAKGFVHCDLKPDNVLLLPSSDSPVGIIPKIADFGLASRPIKRHGCRGMKGTPMYMAPESVDCSDYIPKSDVWALGCIVLEMLTAKKPWKWGVDESVDTLFDRILCSGTLPLIPENISEEAQDFLRHCLVFDHRDRWSEHMLLRHPFVFTQIDDTHINNRVASPRSLSDSIVSCSSCVTTDNKETSPIQIPNNIIHILSSGEEKEYALHQRERAKRRKLYN
ncbi:hypothetical protein ACHQM5_010262 [Ranunculus cassubicifolius]